MKRTIWLSLCLLMAVSAFAQTQQGYVKTKGRLGVNGSVIAGSRIQGVTIQIKGRTSVLSQANGTFSFPVPAKSFYLQNVLKQGFVLTDPEVLSRQYSYSTDPLVLVMEDKAQQEADRREIERKISRKLYAELQKREDEIETLKEENKISEEKYQELLQQLNKYQDDNASIIKEMAERYSKIDFDEVDDFNRRISDCIINGRLTEADSLLRTKGNIPERFSKLNQHHDANVQARANLEKSEELEKRDREDLAQDCYSWFEIYWMQLRNDSAAYYLEFRAALDTANVRWQLDAGSFVGDYLANHEKALNYYKRAETLAKDSSDYRKIYNNIGALYFDTGHYGEALEYYEKAITYYSVLESDKDLPRIYSNISAAYRMCHNMDKALQYGIKALALSQSILGENNITTAGCYNTLGRIYNRLHDYPKSLEYYQKAIDITKELPGNNIWNLSNYYINLAGSYVDITDYTLATKYYMKALELRRSGLGENHPLLGNIYNNLGYVARESGNCQEALNYYADAINYWSKSNDYRFRLIDGYGNIATCYETLGELEKALSAYEKGEVIVEELYQRGESDAMIFLSFIYNVLEKLSAKSTEYHQRYIHYLDDKAVFCIIDQGVEGTKPGMSGLYSVLKFSDWDIESSTSFFDKKNEMNGKFKDVLFYQDGQLWFEQIDDTDAYGWRLYYVTPEEKKQLRTVYEEWKK